VVKVLKNKGGLPTAKSQKHFFVEGKKKKETRAKKKYFAKLSRDFVFLCDIVKE